MTEDVKFADLPAGAAKIRGSSVIHKIFSGGSAARRFARRGIGLSVATAAGQLSYILVLPILSRMFPPAAFGDFIIYLSIVNISAPLAGLRFESALFSTKDSARAQIIFRLSLSTIAFMSAVAGGIIVLAADFLPSEAAHALRPLRLLLPLGIFMAGLWDLASAWAIRRGAMRTLALARFAQPFVLALLQVLFGLLALPAAFLVIAHIASYAAYAMIIFPRAVTREDAAGIAAATLRQTAVAARREIKFLFYTTPAFVITLLISNLPPLLMGSLFGPEIAGNYGIAYRVIYGPLTVISYPLSNIFTAEASASRDPAAVKIAARFMFAVSLLLVAAPAVMFGLAAPQLAPIALGARWELAGHIAGALAFMGAAQALAAPFAEVTSIYRRQEVRLLINVLCLLLSFAPFAFGVAAGRDALLTIRLMAAGGAIGSLLSLFASLLVLKTALLRMAQAKIARA